MKQFLRDIAIFGLFFLLGELIMNLFWSIYWS